MLSASVRLYITVFKRSACAGSFASRLEDGGLQILVHRTGHALILDDTVKILVAHRDGTLHEVSEDVCEHGVVTLDHELPGDDTIVLVRHLVDDEETEGIDTEELRKVVGVAHVATGPRHLDAFP